MKADSDSRESQADEDFARNRLRGIRHAIELFEGQIHVYGKPGHPWQELIDRIKRDCHDVLSRPRSNGRVIDGLEQTIGDLRSQLLDIDAYKMERDSALKRARAAEARIKELRKSQKAGRFERIGRRFDRFLNR